MDQAREYFQRTGQFKSPETKHGTAAAFNKYGCRCDACVTFYRENLKEKNQAQALANKRKAQELFRLTGKFPTDKVKHGTSTSYAYGCRCRVCKSFYSRVSYGYRQKQKARKDQQAGVK